jgi:DNA invertase Pin-like site-specific DNA recombinase
VAKQKEVGVYVRLSKEDSRAGESVSIENQKLMLVKHVKEMGWELKEIYQDDGFSGTNQNRPAFQRMIADVKQGFINAILIKDLSRLGRNYLEVGNLAEVFLPEHGCELISLNEKLDDMMVFRNWFNEQHSKTTSSKVRAARRICAENGKFLGTYAPYGYRKDPANRHRLVIDDATAPIISRIFESRAAGKSYRAIAIELNNEGIVSPREYYYQGKDRQNPCKTNGLWSETSVKDIMKNEVYIGNTVQGKAGTISYKNHKQVGKPEEEWIRAEATHEPLINRGLWDRVQSLSQRQYKPRLRNDGEANLFTGLLYCSDCGFKLRGQIERRKRKDGSERKSVSYMCGTYAHSGKDACTIHGISEKALTELVITHIRTHAQMVDCDEARIIEEILFAQGKDSMSYRSAFTKETEAHKKQIAKLDLLIESLYEDRVTGLVPESMFKRQVQKYERDRADRLASVKALEQRMGKLLRNADNASTQAVAWAAMIKPYSKLETLDTETLLLLIDRIIVHEAQIIGGKRVCDIQIFYNYVGDINWLSGTEGEAVADCEREAI